MSQFSPDVIDYVNFVDDHILKKNKRINNSHKAILKIISEAVAGYVEKRYPEFGKISPAEKAMKGVELDNPADWLHDVIMMRIAEPLFYQSRAPSDYAKQAQQHVAANYDEFLEGRQYGGKVAEGATHGIKQGDWLITRGDAFNVADDIATMVMQQLKKTGPSPLGH